VAGVPTAGGQLGTELVRRGMWEKHRKTGGINHKNGDVIPLNWHRIGQHSEFDPQKWNPGLQVI